MTTTAVTIITSVITALVTILTLMMNFFYARSRPAALPDPQTLSATTTQPDGSTATVKTAPLAQTPEKPI